MKIPDPVLVGWPAFGEPRIVGELSGHGHTQAVIGERLLIGCEVYVVNVSYIPANPRKKQVVVILTPMKRQNVEEMPF